MKLHPEFHFPTMFLSGDMESHSKYIKHLLHNIKSLKRNTVHNFFTYLCLMNIFNKFPPISYSVQKLRFGTPDSIY